MDKIEEAENIALFDLDGTLCDFDSKLAEDLNKIKSNFEPEITSWRKEDGAPEYILNRYKMITSSEEWWENLPKFKLGWDVLEIAKNLGFRIMILTQGPRQIHKAWSGKKKWIDQNLGENFDVTMTRDKGLVFGKILVDDFPPYIEKWLKWRKRGLVIMPANKDNESYKHPQVIRYDGSNIEEVKKAMELAKNRKPLEEVNYA